jgi:predicted dehydrogenase
MVVLAMSSDTKSSLLHEWKHPGYSLRIVPSYVHVYGEIKDQFISYPRNLLILWQYWKRIGTIGVTRKIFSRLKEKERNRKIYGCGIGTIIEDAENSALKKGERVVFFLSNHAYREDVLLVDHRFVIGISHDGSTSKGLNEVLAFPDALQEYIGWSPFSGYQVEAEKVKDAISSLVPYLLTHGISTEMDLSGLKIRERVERKENVSEKPSAVLFGLGNYAKIQIIPNVRKYMNLECIHEIDPFQLESCSSLGVTLDTSAIPRENEKYDVWFISGYHHTHADIAVRALKDTSVAVVEKPLVTDWGQFHSLLDAYSEAGINGGKIFTCFQKRYSPFNNFIYRDMGVEKGDAIDFHCIVYEIPLPRYHWYNWPNSGSRIISNGCHWLDYFMFLNDYCEVRKYGVKRLRDNDLLIDVTLENDAVFTMVLTDKGSQRLGVRENIELRANGVTVSIIDSSSYHAENRFRIIRRSRTNLMNVYRDMYQSICTSILNNSDGDALKSFRSTELMLRFEDELRGVNQ